MDALQSIQAHRESIAPVKFVPTRARQRMAPDPSKLTKTDLGLWEKGFSRWHTEARHRQQQATAG